MLQARGFAHVTRGDVDPLRAAGQEGEAVGELALQDKGHVHDLLGLLTADSNLDDAHVRRGQVVDAHGVRQVLVQLTHVGGLVVQQVGVGLVVDSHVQAVEHAGDLVEPLQRRRGEDLAVKQHAVRVDLRAHGGHEVHLVRHRLEEAAQGLVPAAGAGGEHHAVLAQAAHQVKRL